MKCGPLYKDQGVGAVVNIILYLSLGYHMVLKVVRLKKERVVVSLAAVSVSSIAQPFLSLALRDEKLNKV